MSSYPVKTAARKMRPLESKAVEVIEARPTASFFSFRYSYTEISCQGDVPRVKSRKTRFEGGKLVSETFDGELDRNVYESLVRNAAQFFMSQTATLMDSFLQLLPSVPKSRPDRD